MQQQLKNLSKILLKRGIQNIVSLGTLIIISFCFISPLLFAIPNFKKYPAGVERHQAFFTYLRPLVDQANNKILIDRTELLTLYKKRFVKQQNLTPQQIAWAKELFFKYKVTMSDKPSQWQHLINRVDIIPASLALAQAANETAAGITRFAQQANNFYGMWCHTPGCGLVPNKRAQGDTHEIKKYLSISDSINAYMLNLNTNPHYAIFRQLRAQERRYGKYPSGVILASGLLNYSQQREKYVEALQKIIIQYQLEKTINYSL